MPEENGWPQNSNGQAIAMIEPDCEQIVDSLVDFSDGELPESEVSRVEAHLGECAECQNISRIYSMFSPQNVH